MRRSDGESLRRLRAADLMRFTVPLLLGLAGWTDLALARIAACPIPSDYGRERGVAAQAREALARLDREAPADFELLLSYAESKEDSRVFENPFGHIALRIDETVYTVDPTVRREEDPSLFLPAPLEHYLYGVVPRQGHVELGADYGVTYARDAIGLRVQGAFTPGQDRAERKTAALAEIARIEARWRAGEIVFRPYLGNCAHLINDVLRAAGVHVPKCWLATPLDTFERAADEVARQGLPAQLVHYHRIQDSKNDWRYSRFPWALGHPRDLLQSLWQGRSVGALPAAIGAVRHQLSQDACRTTVSYHP